MCTGLPMPYIFALVGPPGQKIFKALKNTQHLIVKKSVFFGTFFSFRSDSRMLIVFREHSFFCLTKRNRKVKTLLHFYVENKLEMTCLNYKQKSSFTPNKRTTKSVAFKNCEKRKFFRTHINIMDREFRRNFQKSNKIFPH